MQAAYLLGGGVLALGVAIRLAGVAAPAPAVITGAQLTAAAANTEVSLQVVVTERRRARDGRQLLAVETSDRVQTLVYVADDAMAQPVSEGQHLRVRATVVGAQGRFLTAVKPGALELMAESSVEDNVVAVVVNGVAVLDGYAGSHVLAPDIPDGRYVGKLARTRTGTRFCL